MEQNSGVMFHEAQIALARQWVGRNYLTQDVPREVFIKIPQATQEGLVVSDETPMKKEKIPVPVSYEAAVDIVRRFEAGSDPIPRDEDVVPSVRQHALEDGMSLVDELWVASEEEELNWYANFKGSVSLNAWLTMPVVTFLSCFIFIPRS